MPSTTAITKVIFHYSLLPRVQEVEGRRSERDEISQMICPLIRNFKLVRTGNGFLRHEGGVYHDWTTAPWVNSLRLDKYFSMDAGVVTVRENGLYYIYAQVRTCAGGICISVVLVGG